MSTFGRNTLTQEIWETIERCRSERGASWNFVIGSLAEIIVHITEYYTSDDVQ